MKTFVVGYVPVIHEGYIKLFKKYGGVDSSLYVFGKELIGFFKYLKKDIRAVQEPEDIVKMAQSLNIFGNVEVINFPTLNNIPECSRIIMPDEDISKAIAKKFLFGHNVSFSPIFLRWDRNNALKKNKVSFNRSVSYTGLVKELLSVAYEEARKSSDWWRQVGAVAVKNNRIIASAYNHHLPSSHTPYLIGDPRGGFHKGIHIELSSAIHAEAALISAIAAKEGVSLTGADLYVTTFPCPICAKSIAYSGVKRIFFHEGYSMLEAQEILDLFDVEIIYVENKTPNV